MIKMLFCIIFSPIAIMLTVVEFLLELSVKLSTIIIGLFMNILLLCVVIAVCTKQWEAIGVLILARVLGLILVYGNATLLFWAGEVKSYINRLRRV